MVGGVRALQLIHEGAMGAAPARWKTIIAIRNGVGYVFTYTAPREHFAKHLKDFDGLVKSLEWAGPKIQKR